MEAEDEGWVPLSLTLSPQLFIIDRSKATFIVVLFVYSPVMFLLQMFFFQQLC